MVFLKETEKKSICVMHEMVGIVMIQDLRCRCIRKEKWSDIIYLKHDC